MKKKGIYLIVFRDEYAYVGQSVDIELRLSGHKKRLHCCSHPNFDMLCEYNEDDFKFIVLQEVKDNSRLNELEVYYFNEMCKKYKMVNRIACGRQGVVDKTISYDDGVDFRIRRNGTQLFIGDKEISIKDGLYCLSDLIDYLIIHSDYCQNLNELMNGYKVVSRINSCYGTNFPFDRRIVRHLKDMGLYKTLGRGSNRRIYCDFNVFITIAMETCAMIYASCCIFIMDSIMGLPRKC